jgi:methionyl-tRNA synthetase
VWVDALNNYLTGIGFPDVNSDKAHYWPADVHIIGKDIIRFHAIYWPAFLMSADLPLPKQIFGHGFLFNRGEKMSKSVGNVIDPFKLADIYGVDQLRYFFLREVPFGQDGNYSHETIVNRINADLANDLGNLAQRSLSMVAKNCNSRTPQPSVMQQDDIIILEKAYALIDTLRSLIETFFLHQILAEIWIFIGDVNRYFAFQQPWMLKKSDAQRMEHVLYVTLESLRVIGIATQPFMPQASQKLLDLLAVDINKRQFDCLTKEYALRANKLLIPPEPIFPRFIAEESADHAG